MKAHIDGGIAPPDHNLGTGYTLYGYLHARYPSNRRLGLEGFTEMENTIPLTGFRWELWFTGICWTNVRYGEANHTGRA